MTLSSRILRLLLLLRLALGLSLLRLLGCLFQQLSRLLILLGPARMGSPTLDVVTVARFLDAMMEGAFAQHVPPTLMRAAVITFLRSAAVSMTARTFGVIAIAGDRNTVMVSARGTIMARAKGARKGLIECHQVGTGLTSPLGGAVCTTAATDAGGGGHAEGGIRCAELSIGGVLVRIRVVTVGVIAIVITSISLSVGGDGRSGGSGSRKGPVKVWPRKASPPVRLVGVIGHYFPL